ncbi:hypothetical protein ACFFRR_003221 [Megaselia abdita]
MERFIVVCVMIFLCNVWISEAKPRPYYSREETTSQQPKTCGAVLTKRVMNICQNAGGFNEYSRKRDTTTQLQLLLRDENIFIHRRVKRNLVSECCTAVCSDDVIREKYCKAQDPEEVGK